MLAVNTLFQRVCIRLSGLSVGIGSVRWIVRGGNWRVGPATLGHGREQVEEASVFGLLKTPLQLVFHDGDELPIAQGTVPVLIKDGKKHLNHVV